MGNFAKFPNKEGEEMKEKVKGNEERISIDFSKYIDESVAKHIRFLVNANSPIIYIISWEETRVKATIESVVKKKYTIKRNGGEERYVRWGPREIADWSSVKGLIFEGEKGPVPGTKDDPLIALDEIIRKEKSTAFIFSDFHHNIKPGGDPRYIRKLREVASANRWNPHTLFLISPVLILPDELQKDVTVIDYPLPPLKCLRAFLDDVIEQLFRKRPDVSVELGENGKQEMARAAVGLSIEEAYMAYSKSIEDDLKITIDDIELVLAEKEQVIRKTGVMEYFSPKGKPKDISGMDALRKWLSNQEKLLSVPKPPMGLARPKGTLVSGMPGCGKSLCARAISAEWGFPLLRLEMDRLFSVIGVTPEESFRNAIKTAETIAPCILWIDEIEKAFSKTAATETGAASRLFAYFLTWMQEKESSVFIFATANRLTDLPGELLRAQRFEKIWFVDFPNKDDRRKIWKLLLKKHTSANLLSKKEFDKFAKQTEGFSGAEISQILREARSKAYIENDRELRKEDIDDALKEIKPVRPPGLEEIRKKAQKIGAIDASSGEPLKELEK